MGLGYVFVYSEWLVSHSIMIEDNKRLLAKTCINKVLTDRLVLQESKIASIFDVNCYTDSIESICFQDANDTLHMNPSYPVISIYNDNVGQMIGILNQLSREILSSSLEDIHSLYYQAKTLDVSNINQTQKEALEQLDLNKALQEMPNRDQVQINGKVRCRHCGEEKAKISAVSDRLGLDEAYSTYVICMAPLCRAKYKI